MIINNNRAITSGGRIATTITEEIVGGSMIMEFTIIDNQHRVEIPHLGGFNYDYWIDYGDGNIKHVTSWDDPNTINTYSNNGVYTVTISGLCETLYETGMDTPFPNVLTRVIQWGDIGLKSLAFMQCHELLSIPGSAYGLRRITNFYNTFAICMSLTSLPSDLFYYCTGVTDFSNTFNGCYSLLSIPSGLFDNCPDVLSFNSCFSYINTITTIPSGLFDHCPNVIDFGYCFVSCTGLTSIPSGLFTYCPNVASFSVTFAYCTSLTSIPSDLFNSLNIDTDFNHVFYGCTLLTNIPSNLFNNFVNLTTMIGVFKDCVSLTSIPSTLFSNSTKITDFSGCFSGCTGITTIPDTLFNSSTLIRYFSYTFDSCVSLTGNVPNLWYRYKYATGIGCFSNDSGVSNWELIHVDWGGPTPNYIPFKLEITITGSSHTLTLPLLDYTSTKYDFILDYGDGTSTSHITTYNSIDLTHTYINPGIYTLIISGRCDSFHVNVQTSNPLINIRKNITKVIQWGQVGIRYFSFDECINLTGITTDTYSGFTWLLSISQNFRYCTSLVSIPSGLFDYCMNVDDITECFYGCTTLTSIPSGLFDNLGPNGEYFGNIFAYCSGITSIPSGLFDHLTNAKQMVSIFNHCDKLISIPNNLFRYNTLIINTSTIFSNCKSLTTIPSDLFTYNTDIEYVEGLFLQCTGLTSIPSTLFNNCPDIIDFSSAFYSCESLTGNAPTLWTTHPTANGTQCFLGDTGLTNYSSIPAGWK